MPAVQEQVLEARFMKAKETFQEEHNTYMARVHNDEVEAAEQLMIDMEPVMLNAETRLEVRLAELRPAVPPSQPVERPVQAILDAEHLPFFQQYYSRCGIIVLKYTQII